MNAIAKKLIVSLVLLCIPTFLIAHPHMFFSAGAEFVWEKEKLQGVWFEWTFDSFFSADIIYGYDTNGDRMFSPAETADVFANAFTNLKNYYYFTFIRQGERRQNPTKIEKFSVHHKNGIVSYRFYVDLSALSPGPVSVSVYDYTFFCDISYAKNAVKLTYEKAHVQPVFEIVENVDYPVYYNPLGTVDDTTIYYTWKKGLQTYYPREIRIRYEN